MLWWYMKGGRISLEISMCEYVENQIRLWVKLCGKEWDERNMVSWKKEHENFV
jgi:hypothetical protein